MFSPFCLQSIPKMYLQLVLGDFRGHFSRKYHGARLNVTLNSLRITSPDYWEYHNFFIVFQPICCFEWNQIVYLQHSSIDLWWCDMNLYNFSSFWKDLDTLLKFFVTARRILSLYLFRKEGTTIEKNEMIQNFSLSKLICPLLYVLQKRVFGTKTKTDEPITYALNFTPKYQYSFRWIFHHQLVVWCANTSFIEGIDLGVALIYSSEQKTEIELSNFGGTVLFF